MNQKFSGASTEPTLKVETASFHGHVSTTRHAVGAAAAVVAAVAIMVAGLAGPPAERHEGIAQNAATAAPVGVAPNTKLTVAQVLENQLIAEARALNARDAYRKVTVAEVMEQRSIMESLANRPEQAVRQIAPSHR